MRFFRIGDRVRVVHGTYAGNVGTVTGEEATMDDIRCVEFDDVALGWAHQFEWKLSALSPLEELAECAE